MTFENGSADSLRVETNSGAVSLVKITVKKEIFVKAVGGEAALAAAAQN